MLYIITHGSAFNFVPVGCGEVPKFFLVGYNNFLGTFLPCLFFGQKHPRFIILPVFVPKTGYVQRIHSTGQGSGVRRGAVRE